MADAPTINNANANDDGASVLPNHSALYFGSTRGGNYDIYRAAHGAGGFSAAAAVSGVHLARR